jgi:hypothetical protein
MLQTFYETFPKKVPLATGVRKSEPEAEKKKWAHEAETREKI